MNLINIKKFINSFITDSKIDRSNISGDSDFFSVEIKNNYVVLSTSIGHSRYGSWKKFNFSFKNGSSKKYILSNDIFIQFLDYFNSCKSYRDSYISGLQAHYKSSSAHQGNPVYLD